MPCGLGEPRFALLRMWRSEAGKSGAVFSAHRGIGNVVFQLLAQALDVAGLGGFVDGHLCIEPLEFVLNELEACQLGLGGIAETVKVVFVAVDRNGGHSGGAGRW